MEPNSSIVHPVLTVLNSAAANQRLIRLNNLARFSYYHSESVDSDYLLAQEHHFADPPSVYAILRFFKK